MIAQALRKHETSIIRHLTEYVENEKLRSESHLNTIQTEALIQHLSNITYSHTHQICTYIAETWSVYYSVSGLNKWRHNKGFSYKRPKGVPHKFDQEKQDAFIAHYKALKANLTDNDALLFMDAVHPTQATKVTSGWIRTGVDNNRKQNTLECCRCNKAWPFIRYDHRTIQIY